MMGFVKINPRIFHLTKSFTVFIVTAFLVFHGYSQAEEFIKTADFLKTMIPKKEQNKELYLDWGDKFLESVDFLKNQEQKQRRLDLSVDIGFSGNRTDKENLYKLDVGANIKGGRYPHEFRFNAETSVQYKDDVLQEDITTTLVNYDYNIFPWLETYGFAERFSNSYLSIDQRYEIGMGLKVGKMWGLTTGIKQKLDDFKDSFSEFKNHIEKQSAYKKSPAYKKSIDAQLKEFCDGAKKVKSYLKKEHAKFEADIGISLFVELERAEFEATAKEKTEANGTEEKTTTEKFYPTDQMVRLSIRPSLTWRITDDLSLFGLVYWKVRLDEARKANGDFDFRRDSLLRAQLKLPGESGWAKNLSLIFEYRQHYDNIPPELTAAMCEEVGLDIKGIEQATAQKIHHYVRFVLNVQF
jgi:hypothetical protein